MWGFVLSMAGFPLTGGFLGKLFVFSAIYEAGWWWLVVIGVLATALSLAYYLTIVRALYMRQGDPVRGEVVAAGGSPPRDLLLDTAVAAALVVTIGSFFFVQPLVDLAAARRLAAALAGTERGALAPRVPSTAAVRQCFACALALPFPLPLPLPAPARSSPSSRRSPGREGRRGRGSRPVPQPGRHASPSALRPGVAWFLSPFPRPGVSPTGARARARGHGDREGARVVPRTGRRSRRTGARRSR